MPSSLGSLLFLSLLGLPHAKDEAVVFVVEPTWDCVESYVANVPLLQEYKIVKVMTRLGEAPACNSDRAEIYQNITYNSWSPNDDLAAEEICPKLKNLGFPVAAVIATFDPAVALTDRLAACLGVRGNPVHGVMGSKARHDKWFISEAVRKAGLRSVKEKIVSSVDEAREFIDALNPPLSQTNPVIFKILRGSSSEGVQKVTSLEQADEILGRELGSTTKYGDSIGQILIQEFLHGEEYVIDSVSRDGVHKVSIVWNEDLRPGNGIFNLYYGFKSMDPQDRKTKIMIDYANKVLDATGLQNGAADMEVKWLEEEDGPCLVDLNARWTALMWREGLLLEKKLTGTDQITSTIKAYLDGDAFDELPAVPPSSEHGAIIFSNVFRSGILRGIPGMAVVESLPSYFASDNNHAVVGKPIEKFTAGTPPITILLAGTDASVVDADYDTCIDLVDTSASFFDIAPPPVSLRLGSSTLPGSWHLAFAALAMFAATASVALTALSRRSVNDGTEYLSIE